MTAITSATIQIEDWGVVDLESHNVYTPPEYRAHGLYGKVFGHPNFPDKCAVTSSAIVGRDIKNLTITTASGRIYKLGKPAEEYERLYPNALQRIFTEKR